MMNKELEELINEAGAPCISIIIGTHRVSAGRQQDEELVAKTVKQAKEIMQNYRGDDLPELTERIDALVEQIDYIHTKDGLGIYVSPRIARMVHFPFPVTTKIKADRVFETRDLEYYADKIIDYYILSISQKYIHLFSAKGEEISEIKNGDFPITYEETYEYERSSRGTSFGNTAFKDFERDKSVMKEIRITEQLRKADHLLAGYINNSASFVIAGGKKEIADFLKVTAHKKNVIAKVEGHYNSHGTVQLAAVSWQQVREWQKEQNAALLSRLHELIGQNRLAVGIEEAWKAAKEGKGLELVVEKDFECHGFHSPDGYILKAKRPLGQEEYTYTADAVEQLIREVRKKKGKITFLENGAMEDLGHIALELRYTGAGHE